MQPEIFRVQGKVEDRHWWFAARRQILLDVVHEVFPPGQQRLLLDVGCGTGGNLALLSREYRCLGIDPSPEAIEQCRSRFPEVRFICGSAPEDLAELEAPVGMVLLTDVLEHVPDDFHLLSNLLSATEPGTFFLLTVPADASLWSVHDESHGHYRRYHARRFQQIWLDLPVDCLLMTCFNWRLYPAIRMARAISRWRGGGTGVAGSDLKLPWTPVNWLLQRVFAGERRSLLKMLRGERPPKLHGGVSLMALLRRREGKIEPRSRPEGVEADLYQPAGA